MFSIGSFCPRYHLHHLVLARCGTTVWNRHFGRLLSSSLDHRPASGPFDEEDYMSAYYVVESLFYGMEETFVWFEQDI